MAIELLNMAKKKKTDLARLILALRAKVLDLAMVTHQSTTPTADHMLSAHALSTVCN